MIDCSLNDNMIHGLNVKVLSSLPGLVGLGLPGRCSWQSEYHTASKVYKRACSRCCTKCNAQVRNITYLSLGHPDF